MPRPGRNQTNEKAKDFMGSMKRLIKHLRPWRTLMILSLILAASSAVLALISPNKLSELTDTITAGLAPNTKKLEDISKEIGSSFNEENLTSKIPIIMSDEKISDSEKEQFSVILNKISEEKDQAKLLANIIDIPSIILQTILTEFEIDGQKINVDDQIVMLEKLSQMGSETGTSKALELIDELPVSVYDVIKPHIDMEMVTKIAIILAVLFLLSALFGYIENYSMTTISNNFARKLRTNISKKINKLPLKYFDTHEHGDVLSRVTNDVDMIAQNLNNSLSTLVASITMLVGALLMMFITNAVMAGTAIVSSLLGFSLMFLILAKSQKYFELKQSQLGDLNGYIEEMYSGHNVVKAYNGTKDAILEFENLNRKLYESNRKSQFLSGLMQPIMGFIGNFGYVAVCIVGALLALNGHITFGVIVAFMIYIRLFTNPLAQIAQAMTSLQSTVAASERVFEFMDEAEMTDESNLRRSLSKSKVRGEIEFKNVKFGYNRNRTIINNFSAKAEPGQKIAIVGPTGAGKTTLVNLLMKFYEINGGDILIDGVSTKDLTRENIHDLFIMVLQDTWLFDGTIGENIRFNKENVSDEDVWRALHTVGVDHFVKTLPGGLDAKINDSDAISGGQKQLLTIARGMIEDAPFLILDEATSNVDTRTEELVQKAMDLLTKGRTSFIIAHRLSTIKNADLILVMKDGNIIEQGNHDELIKKDGFYAELYNSQFQTSLE